MNKKSNMHLYIGLILVLIGTVFFLDLNNILPPNYATQVFNIIAGISILVIYFKNKKLYTLMLASFLLLNGLLLTVEPMLPGYNGISAGLLIPGFMLIIAYIARKDMVYLIPGAVMASLGSYILLITVGVISGFSSVTGMFFVFCGLSFLIIFLCERRGWAGLTGLILVGTGGLIALLGVGALTRHLIFNIIALGAILFGAILMIKGLIKNKDDERKGE